MPTARGWLVAATGVCLVIAGLAFGARPLQQVGVALAVLMLVAVAVVRLGKHDLEVRRVVVPERAHADQEVTVTLVLRNNGSGPAPLLLLEDRLPSSLAGRARFALSGIEAEGRRDLTYTVRPHRRGRYRVGPLSMRMVDPFGLARITSEAASTENFLVHPRIETLALPRDAGDRRNVSTSTYKQPTGARGEDFYALREYVQGDDLRKVHWPSTARRGKVMIRQEETPWHTRATVVLDDRAGAHAGGGDSASFERAIEATASVLHLYHHAGYGFRLAGAGHPGLASARGVAHLHRCMDLLATMDLQPERGDNPLLARLTEIEARGAGEETLVVVGGTLGTEVAVALGRLRRVFKQIVCVSYPAHRFSSASTKQRWAGEQATVDSARHLARSGIRSVIVGPGDSLETAWRSIASGKTRGGEEPWAQKPELV